MYDFLSLFAIAYLNNDKIPCNIRGNSVSFKNSKFYSYNLQIAFYEDLKLNIYKYSKKTGGVSVSVTTSKHITNLINFCEMYNIKYELLDIPETNLSNE
jgi:hypothetical protein